MNSANEPPNGTFSIYRDEIHPGTPIADSPHVMGTLIHEILYAIRVLNKHKRNTLIGLLTLTLLIAANITVFSATNAFLMRLMAVPEAQFLIRLYRG